MRDGPGTLGRYANFTLIASVFAGTISLFFTPLTSVVGHLCTEGDHDRTRAAFDKLYCLNYALGVVSFLGYCALADRKSVV